jgi:bifunctional non-homologous end joining protein LigD
MGKKADAPYRGGRRSEWLKVRGERTDEFAVVGYTQPEGARTGFGALDLAVWDGSEFLYAGSVGTGFSEADLQAIHQALEKTRTPRRPFQGDPVPGRKHVWVEPTLVVEVAYFTWTADGMLRHPKFLRRRDDRTVKECLAPPERLLAKAAAPAAAKVGALERRVVLSNQKKVFWPEDGYTKGDLVEYYRAISPWLLPYLRERPVVLTRFPDGIQGKSFFQKDAPPFVPEWLRTVRIWSEQTSREIDYFVCDDEASVTYLANLGTIPLHIWSSRVGALQAVDWSILDLDPKGAPFADVVKVAKKIREICEAIELPSFVKTSGSSGLHVLIPLGGRCTYQESRTLAELISRVVITALPEIATLERVIGARGGKVYLDYLQNGHGKLLVAPFSVRPLPGAPVSMPLKWSEVNLKNHPTAFNIRNALKRMEKLGRDPMVDVLTEAPDLPAALARLGERMVKLIR